MTATTEQVHRRRFTDLIQPTADRPLDVRRDACSETACAVWLGCTSPQRLATERGISKRLAYELLHDATRLGLIRRERRSVYACTNPPNTRSIE